MRFDWLSTAVISLCVFHKRKLALAGALLAYAGCMRIFPFIFFLPFGAVVLRELITEKIDGSTGAPGTPRVDLAGQGISDISEG